jgi:hypothetical protein
MKLTSRLRKLKYDLIVWFDYQVVYRVFVWRFDKKFRENPAMRQAFADQLIGWGIQHEEQIKKQRSEQIKLVDPT